MLNSISILFTLIVIFQYSRDTTKGILLFFYMSFFLPYLDFSILSFRSELIVVPVLLFITIFKKKYNLIIPLPFFLFFSFLSYCLIVSFLNRLTNYSSSINYVTIFNYFRFVALILIGANLDFSKKTLQDWKIHLFLSSIPISILSFGLILQSELANFITQKFYTSISRSVFISQVESLEKGYTFRSIGVFENVSFYATYILIVLVIGFTFLLMNEKSPLNKRLVLCCLILNILAGISTFSVTFYLGFIFILFYYFFKKPLQLIKYTIISITFFSLIFLFFWNRIDESVNSYLNIFNYLLNSVTEGSRFVDRYFLSSRENGDLSQILIDTWIFGNGFRYYDNYLVNDSLYLEFFYQGGIFGSAIFFIFIFFFIYKSFLIKFLREEKIYLIFVLLLIAGVGCNSFLFARFSEWFWILIGIISLYRNNMDASVLNTSSK